MSHRVLLFGVLVGAFLLPRVASAQATYQLLYRFEPGPVGPVGRLAEAPDGSLFGMTYRGGRFGTGTVFALRPSTSAPWSAEVVHDFKVGPEGGFPWGSLTLGRDGNFYGLTTTNQFPSPNASGGTVFRMTPSGDFSLLHTFTSPGDGIMPVWRLLEASDGNFYGSTCHAAYSTVFRVTPTGSFTALYRLFVRPPSYPFGLGVCPVTELWEGPDGFLYGQATYAGPYTPVTNGGGTLFRIDPRDSPPQRFALLHAFSGPDGAQPVGGLVPGPGGALYGSAYEAGPFGKGLIFRTEPTGGVTTVHAFEGPDGAHPYGSLFPAADGSLYGTASEGGTGFGTLFKIDAAGQFSRLHAFGGADGQAPIELMQARDGKIYGVTYRGGPGIGGTAFRLNPDNTLETLHAFGGPGGPHTGVIEAPDGTLYGTTRFSVSGAGSAFKLSPDRQLTVLHDFGSDAGASGLIQAADGYFYGTTEVGGTHGLGTVFRIDATGGHTVLH
ncbi:MAG TPA: choice-of-anchor tandem repeat GloVer-containing protein, partial [Vicinamibacteria bacterium]